MAKTDPISEKQRAFIEKLLDTREVAGDVQKLRDGLDTLTVGTASVVIDALMKLPYLPAADTGGEGLDLSGMTSGRYAVPDGDSRLKVKIDVVEKGKWAGWVFVKDAAVYGEGTRYGAQRPGGRYQGKIVDQLAAIVADPHGAMAAYGQLTGTCGRCGLPLEDETSVALGIGPVCRQKMGVAA